MGVLLLQTTAEIDDKTKNDEYIFVQLQSRLKNDSLHFNLVFQLRESALKVFIKNIISGHKNFMVRLIWKLVRGLNFKVVSLPIDSRTLEESCFKVNNRVYFEEVIW